MWTLNSRSVLRRQLSVLLLSFVMPKIKFGQTFGGSRAGEQNDPEVQDSDGDDIEVMEVVELEERIETKTSPTDKKVRLSFNQTKGKKPKFVTPTDSKCEKTDRKLVEYLEQVKAVALEKIAEREGRIITILKKKDIELRNMTFEKQSLVLVIEQRDETIRMLGNEREEEKRKHIEEIERLKEEIERLRLNVEECSQQNREVKSELDQSYKEQRRLTELIKTEGDTSKEELATRDLENAELKEELLKHKRLLEESHKNKEEMAVVKEKNIRLEKKLTKALEDFDKEKRNHKRELENRVKRSNSKIEELKKELANANKKDVLEKELKNNVSTDDVKEKAAVGNPRDPRLKTKKIANDSDKKEEESFFSNGMMANENPFNQRPDSLKKENSKMKQILEEGEILERENNRQAIIKKQIFGRRQETRYQIPHQYMGYNYNYRHSWGYVPYNQQPPHMWGNRY